jgi:phosphate transport system protein
MPRETLDHKIREILDDVLMLDSMVEKASLDAVDALKRRDLDAARRVYAADQQINEKRYQIENETVVTIATQQPVMAGDLRFLASVLVIITELERIGDYAKGIAQICLRMGYEPPVKPLIDIPRMCQIGVSMLHRAVAAFVSGDVDAARLIPRDDDEVDALYNQIYRELVTIMLTDPSIIDRANYLMWVAHNLERMADRVTNICERTVYVGTGEMREIRHSDDDALE